MENINGKKLNFELVPDGCWYSNLRSVLTKSAWQLVRNDAILRSNGRCSICGRKPKTLDAHERWSYDIENGIQKLEDVIAVCKDCHAVIHIGRTQLVGDIVRAEEHYMKVNNCTYSEMRQDLGKANEEHKMRNQVSEWKLDLTYLQKFIKG